MTAVRFPRAAGYGARLLLALLTAWALGQALGQESAERGAQLYEQHCAACHQSQGEGVEGTYPALAGNEVVVGDPHSVIRPPLAGPGTMPSFAETLSNAEIAAVVSHIRTSWGNDAEAVSAGDVAAVRQEVDGAADGEDGAADEDVSADPQGQEQAEDETAEDARALPADFDWREAGQVLFESYCAACHQSEGQGAGGVFPPLAGNPFVTGDPGGVVHTVLFGRAGMPSFQGLDDEAIAAVVSYIRNAWGNEASVVAPDTVMEQREEGVWDLTDEDEDEDRPGAAD